MIPRFTKKKNSVDRIQTVQELKDEIYKSQDRPVITFFFAPWYDVCEDYKDLVDQRV